MWLDGALCALVAMLSTAALFYGVLKGIPAVTGMAAFGLSGAAWVASVLLDGARRQRALAVREALDRVWR